MKKILFDAHTPYQLLVAASLSYIYYPNDFTTLLIGSTSFSNIQYLKSNIEKSMLFSRVEITQEKSEKSILIEQIKNLDIDDTDIFHFSSYSATSSCYLYNKLLNHSKIVLNEEGVATYNLFEKYEEFINLFPSNIRDDVALDKLSEIWLFNKTLYQSNCKEKVKEIDMGRVKDELLFVKKLNILFDYQFSKIEEKNIFFTQIFLDYGVVSEKEMEDFYENMSNQFKGELILKLHPFDKNIEMYNRLNIKTLQNIDKVPWELVLLNHILEDALDTKTFLTVGSTSLSALSLFLKYKNIEHEHNYILMTKLLDTPFNKSFEKHYQKLASLTSFKFVMPVSFDLLGMK